MDSLRVLVALSLLVACGDDAPTVPSTFAEACTGIPGCDMADVVVPDGPPLAIWRVLVVRDGAGVVTIEAVEEIDLNSSIGVPLGPLHGELGLAGLNVMGEPLEVQLIRFPTRRYYEGLDETTGDEEDLTGQTVSAVGYLQVREEVDTLAIVDTDGMIQSSIVAPAPGDAIRMAETEEGGSSALIQAAPSGACAHVMILDGVDDGAWNPTDSPSRSPTPTQRALIRAALGRMTPVHCMGVSRIGLIDRDGSPGSVASWEGDFINISVNYVLNREGFDWVGFDDFSLQDSRAQALFESVLLHEAAHATTYLLSAAAAEEGGGPVGIWAPTARSLAEMTVDRARLRGDIVNLWGDMHESFVDLDWANSYYEIPPLRQSETVIEQELRIGARDLSYASHKQDPPDEIVASGFMSPYGGLNVYEDIAEFATWPVVFRLYERAGIEEGPGALRRGYACPDMAAHDTRGVPQSLAAPFTKVTFMRDLGFITQSDYDDCIGMFLTPKASPSTSPVTFRTPSATTPKHASSSAPIVSGSSSKPAAPSSSATCPTRQRSRSRST